METKSYLGPKPSLLLRNRHFQTIFASAGRTHIDARFERRRLELIDGDFLDLDLLLQPNDNSKLAILSHGLEGSTHARYIRALADLLNQKGINVLAWNYRGCSGEPNRLESLYHSGLSSDLDAVVQYAQNVLHPKSIGLIGFSIGGNITLKYLGEIEKNVPAEISAAVAISVPVDLKACALTLEKGFGKLYTFEFLRSLQAKIRAKRLQGSSIPDFSLRRITTFKHYDEEYTAPLHGFSDAEDYYKRASAMQYVAGVKVPTLIINALDDPFLDEHDRLRQIACQSNYLQLEQPNFGAHNGFLSKFSDRYSWAELRCVEFLEQQL